MATTCEFSLNKKKSNYYNGETIRGIITLNKSGGQRIKGISVIFNGEANVKWVKFSKGFKPDGFIRDHDVFLNDVVHLPDEKFLPTGRHMFRFAFCIPLECPQSCRYRDGEIHYEIVLEIKFVDKDDYVFRHPITILKTLDLNSNLNYKLPIVRECFNTALPWNLFANETYFHSLEIFCGAYVPGQTVKYILKKSQHFVESHTVSFYRKITFTARTPTETTLVCTTNLLKKQHSYLNGQIFKGEFVIPPNIRPTDISSLIKVEYIFGVNIKTPNCISGYMQMPIVIGTIPFKEYSDDIQMLNFARNPLLPELHKLLSEDAETAESLRACRVGEDLPTIEERPHSSSSLQRRMNNNRRN